MTVTHNHNPEPTLTHSEESELRQKQQAWQNKKPVLYNDYEDDLLCDTFDDDCDSLDPCDVMQSDEFHEEPEMKKSAAKRSLPSSNRREREGGGGGGGEGDFCH